MKQLTTFYANIYLGLQHGYSGALASVDEVRKHVQHFCTDVKLGVTFTLTEFIYVDGGEPGIIIGLINYPRFPRPAGDIKAMALTLAHQLMTQFHQERVSVVCSDETIMLEKEAEKTYLDYDFNEFKKQMAEATVLLKKMNRAANHMRWQYEMDEAFKEFEREVSDASGWLSSWCG